MTLEPAVVTSTNVASRGLPRRCQAGEGLGVGLGPLLGAADSAGGLASELADGEIDGLGLTLWQPRTATSATKASRYTAAGDRRGNRGEGTDPTIECAFSRPLREAGRPTR